MGGPVCGKMENRFGGGSGSTDDSGSASVPSPSAVLQEETSHQALSKLKCAEQNTVLSTVKSRTAARALAFRSRTDKNAVAVYQGRCGSSAAWKRAQNWVRKASCTALA